MIIIIHLCTNNKIKAPKTELFHKKKIFITTHNEKEASFTLKKNNLFCGMCKI